MRVNYFFLVALVGLAGCDSGTGDTDAGRDSSIFPIDSGAPEDSGTAEDSGTPVDAGPPVDSGPGMPTLTINNIFAWCSVTVNGGAPSTLSTITTDVAPGVVNLHAEPVGTFIWDYGWDGTDGDPGTGATQHDIEMDTTVTVTGDTTVRVCCPFPDGTGCD